MPLGSSPRAIFFLLNFPLGFRARSVAVDPGVGSLDELKVFETMSLREACTHIFLLNNVTDKAGAFILLKQAEEDRVRRGGAAAKEAAASWWRLRAP